MHGTRKTDSGPLGFPLWTLGLVALLPTALCLLTFVLPLLPRPPAIGPDAGALLVFAVAVLVLPTLLLYGGVGLCLLGWTAAGSLRRGRDEQPSWRLRYAAALLAGAALPFVLTSINPQLDRLDERPTRHIVKRGSEVASALESFRSEQGHYPGALSDLVPRHLPALPRVNLLGYSEFKYERSTGDDEWRNRHDPSDPPYDLWVEGHPFSELHYWPGGYPEERGDDFMVVRHVDGWVEFIYRD